MIFENPAGLWFLLGIPVLIIIYLIRSQHEDRSVSSTYIWKLSTRFAKKRLPIQRLRKILLFVLQLLMITALALVAAKPAVVKGQTYDYIVILDASASMAQKNDDGTTRFERAVKEIEELTAGISQGHTVTVILAGESPSYLINKSSSANEVKVALNKAVCTQGSSNTAEAISLAQEMCDRTQKAKVLFYTDKTFEKAGNISVINLDENEWNVSLQGLKHSGKKAESVFTGTLISYNKDAEVSVGLRIDGKNADAGIVKCIADTETQIEFRVKDLASFDVAEIYIESKDGLASDNSFALCKRNNKKHKILLVSESPLYLESALGSIENCQVDVVGAVDEAANVGYDLYVYDGIAPEDYPTDGSVILFGTDNLPPGIRSDGDVEGETKLTVSPKAESPVVEGIVLESTVVNGFGRLVVNDLWQVLMVCRYTPVVATTQRAGGTKFTVFSFDLHNSNLPLKKEFLMLVNNLVEWSIPSMIDITDYSVGQTVTIAKLPDSLEMYLEYPDGNIRNLGMSEESCNVTVNEVGVYTAVTKFSEGGDYADFFVHINAEEFTEVGGSINVSITEKETEAKEDAELGVWFWFAIVILLMLLVEWGVYYYEQY